MTDRNSIEKLVAEVLDGTELRLKVDKYTAEEILESGKVRVHCEVHDEHTGEPLVIEGAGVGLVDAFFSGLKARYSDEFPSLKSIRFADFSIAADVDSTREPGAGSDMPATVTLRVANSEGREFAFVHSSPSITGSCVAVVLHAVAFFINSERAYVSLYRALEFAREQNRVDSVRRYTAQMATLVEATSYSEVIEQIRNDDGE
jgi:hypothetical protein